MAWQFGPEYFRDNVALRNDTLLGACEAIGQDFGFHPNFLRIPLASGIIFAPFMAVGLYLALGVLVFVSRTFFPRPVAQTAPAEEALPPVSRAEAVNDGAELPRAA